MTDRAPLPFEFPPAVGEFILESTDVADGQKMPLAQASDYFGAGGEELSPALAWRDFPAETKSFVVTCFDPDAPTGSGFWHWVMANIPASTQALERGAGAADGSGLPEGAIHLKNDAGLSGFLGAAPPEGHGPHRYAFTVHALSVPSLPIDENASPALCGFNMFGTTLARARIVPTYER
jgi:Raf kinase inhibitor-like YbhB/YbcL family protein